ncbi:MAG: NADPH-dependent FMN reductase, partial [Paenibacillaceae bacterium]
RTELNLSLYTDFEDFSVFRPTSDHEETLNRMLDELSAWSSALRGVREASAQAG